MINIRDPRYDLEQIGYSFFTSTGSVIAYRMHAVDYSKIETLGQPIKTLIGRVIDHTPYPKEDTVHPSAKDFEAQFHQDGDYLEGPHFADPKDAVAWLIVDAANTSGCSSSRLRPASHDRRGRRTG